MIEHTPGPWKVQPLVGGAYGIWDGLNRLVGQTRTTANTSVDKRPGSPSRPEVIRANAHLMAAAPTLLEALKAIIALADDGAYLDLADTEATPVSRQAREAIEAAS